MDRIRLGIIGLGRLGRRHAENIHYAIPGAELAAVCSTEDEELERAGEELRPRLRTRDYREVLADGGLDGIVIAATSQEHCRMICDAAEAGKRYVFTEKPLGMTLEEIDRIRAAVQANRGLRLQVGYNRRFDPSVAAAKKKIDEGYVGRIVQVRMINRDPASMAEFIIKFSPQSGGLVMDMLGHDYDCARWFVGSEAKSVYGVGGVFAYQGLQDVGDIDNCSLLMEFENGVMGQIETSRSCPYGYHVETEIYGTKGCIRIGTVPARDRNLYMGEGGVTQTCAGWFYEYWEPTFRAELLHFVDCIRQDRQPLVGLEDGYRAVEWAVAATAAVREKKIVRLH